MTDVKTLLVTLELRIRETVGEGTEILGKHGSWMVLHSNPTHQGAIDALNSGLMGNPWTERYDFEIVEEPQS